MNVDAHSGTLQWCDILTFESYNFSDDKTGNLDDKLMMLWIFKEDAWL
jgi:hypothetical protein